MRRMHLFEWEDQPWLPPVLRDFITDHLHHTLGSTDVEGLHREIARRLADLMRRAGTREIVDLCSGGGGPLLAVNRHLGRELGAEASLTLTDLFPNRKAFRRIETAAGPHVRCCYEPTSAFDVPAELKGVRTMFTALHHFRPSEARRVLADAAAKKRAIAIFEPIERSAAWAIGVPALGFLRGLAMTPFVGTLSWQRIALTYALPLCPAVLAWDGFVSVLRAYGADDLLELTRGLGGKGYEWEAGRGTYKGPLGSYPYVYLLGCPRR